MTLPAYPAYKDSGVEWLGKVPEHWAVHTLKRAIAQIESGTSVNAADFPAEPGSFGVLKTSCVYTGEFDWTENKTVDDADIGRVSCPLRVNTLIVSRMNTPDLVGATGLVTEAPEGIFLPDRLWQIYFSSSHSPEFIFYFTKSLEYREQVKIACSGTSSSMQNLGQDDFRCLLFAEPPRSEQIQIARFLDHETARIDALIEEQQRLIKLLKEKRQAVISHAVTKGLDPTVPMKDSGVEWLGEVPAHWTVCTARRVIRAIEQGWSPECEAYPADDEGWGVLKAGCVNRGVFDPSENKTLPPSLEPIAEYEVQAGDILMSRASGTPELVGSTALLGEVRERLMLSDKIFRIHLENKISSALFVWVMNAQFMRAQIEQALSGGNGMANNLPQSSLLAFWVVVPPDHEQDAIAEHIKLTVGKVDALINEGSIAIGFLQERRSALISAAVTGKIDVRGWQPAASRQAPQLAIAEAV